MSFIPLFKVELHSNAVEPMLHGRFAACERIERAVTCGKERGSQSVKFSVTRFLKCPVREKSG